MILSNARIVTFDSTNRVLDSGAVEILPDGTIGAVHSTVPRRRTIDLQGKLLMPALVNCHTHLYSTLARGIALPGAPPKNFPEILKKLWWRLDRALDKEDVYYSALVGLIDAAKCGVGTLADHHSSPGACIGSLDAIEQAFRQVGLRGVLCYETSDRNGATAARDGIRENVRFIERHRQDQQIAATFGLHASFTLTDQTLRRCVEANASLQAGFHVHVAEDRCDAGAVRRLCRFGALDARSLAAHCVHVTNSEMDLLRERRVNVIHNPQSNCNNAVGAARLRELVRRRVLVGLGSDGYSPRLWEELKTGFHVQKLLERDPRAGYLAVLLNNRIIARKLWGMDVGRIETGARADLVLVDYYPPTPLNGDNLFGHLLFGISNAPVDSLIVNGRYVVRGKKCVTMDERAIAEKAAARARALWNRL